MKKVFFLMLGFISLSVPFQVEAREIHTRELFAGLWTCICAPVKVVSPCVYSLSAILATIKGMIFDPHFEKVTKKYMTELHQVRAECEHNFKSHLKSESLLCQKSMANGFASLDERLKSSTSTLSSLQGQLDETTKLVQEIPSITPVRDEISSVQETLKRSLESHRNSLKTVEHINARAQELSAPQPTAQQLLSTLPGLIDRRKAQLLAQRNSACRAESTVNFEQLCVQGTVN